MGSGVYILERQQWVSRLIERVFTFFSDAHNLEELTPPWLTFRIFSLSSATVSQGTGIRYRLRLHRMPFRWLTEILIWDPPHRLVDLQRSGPFRLWHHTHLFELHGAAAKIIDVVRQVRLTVRASRIDPTRPQTPQGRTGNLPVLALTRRTGISGPC